MVKTIFILYVWMAVAGNKGLGTNWAYDNQGEYGSYKHCVEAAQKIEATKFQCVDSGIPVHQ